MTLKAIQECDTHEGWTTVDVESHSNPDISYTCVIQEPDDTEGVICECDGYIYRGSCSHQQEALELLCRWTEGEYPEPTSEQYREKICPRCLGPTHWTMIDAEV
jgi:hypothetical protein